MLETEIAKRPVDEMVPDLRGGFKKLNPKQLNFLRAYAESMDEDVSAKDAGYPDAGTVMESQIVVAEMERIQEAWFYENRMTAKYTSGEHMRLMNKFEKKYDDMTDDNKAKMASTLAKMSDTALKASGKLNVFDTQPGTTVLVQMNFGDQKGEPIEIKPAIDGVIINADHAEG